jgi:hypothetical protein
MLGWMVLMALVETLLQCTPGATPCIVFKTVGAVF